MAIQDEEHEVAMKSWFKRNRILRTRPPWISATILDTALIDSLDITEDQETINCTLPSPPTHPQVAPSPTLN
jgi:hypothetical protein